jgi:hypothetical protein
MKAPPCFEDPETKRIVKQICEEHRIDMVVLKDVCELVQERSGEGRKFGLDAEISDILSRFLNDRSTPI